MSTPANASDISTLLKHKAVDVKAWFDTHPGDIDNLVVRKNSASAQISAFIPSGQDREPDSARFELLVQYGEKRWAVKLEMAFYSTRWVSEGSINLPGLMFNALDSNDKPTKIAYFTLKYTPTLDAMDAETWCRAWVQKVLKHPEIKHLFAHKVPLEAVEEE